MSGLFPIDTGEIRFVPRPYQTEADNETFALHAKGHIGVLVRAFTGAGKTPMSCMTMSKWLARGPDFHAMVVSYETQLVWQFAEEIKDFLGIEPGIEMEKETIHPDRIPKVVVACRASLLRAPAAEQEQIDELKFLGIDDLGACDKRACAKIIRAMRKGADHDYIREQIREFNRLPEVANGFYSRIHKFDWRKNWLVVFDEAHRHAKHLLSVGHIVDWFEQNPNHRRYGMTATPKLSSGVSIGHKMFPAIALDYPLYSAVKPCGVKDGWAVPYVQKYIEVEGVDFKSLKKIAGDFDPEELERILGAEITLAKLIEPLLDQVGDRRTLIFSAGVEMAKNVALYINARSPVDCPHCQKRKWYPTRLIGDGAKCECGQLVESSWIARTGTHAEALWGSFAPVDRKEIYRGHQGGKFQFLSVCGLCREGYNDPDIACVAVFRPISKKASSLAEQLKGRACRPLREIVPLLNVTTDADERCRLIAESKKPNALIIDLTGITGLADCASTVQIYAEGLPDEVKEKAEKLLEEKAREEETDVEDVIEEAKRICDEERERIRKEREEAERRAQEEFAKRAKAQAEVKYTAHEAGIGSNFNPNDATEPQLKYIGNLGIVFHGFTPTKKLAGRIIDHLRRRIPFEDVARACWLKDGQWSIKGPSDGQLRLLAFKGIALNGARCVYDATLLINAKMDPIGFEERKLRAIRGARNNDELTATAKDIMLVRHVLPAANYQRLVKAGNEKRYSWRGDAAE